MGTVVLGGVARGVHRRHGTAPEREHVGRRERRRVGGRVGTSPGNHCQAHATDRKRSSDGDGEHANHDDRHAPVVSLHFSTRITTRDRNIGSGKSGPTSGKSVCDS